MSKISIVVSTNRPAYWSRFNDSISKNSVELELLLVGPLGRHEESSKLTVPTRFLQTNNNPSLCWETGCRAATGDLLCYAPDDVCFTPGFFDAAAIAAKNMGEFDMLTARFCQNGEDRFGGMRMMSQSYMPLTPVCGVKRTASHYKLGGIDRRFHAVLWDLDMYSRMLEAGGRTTLLEGYICDEVGSGNNLFVINYERDYAVLQSLWFANGKWQLTRQSPTQSYTTEETIIQEV